MLQEKFWPLHWCKRMKGLTASCSCTTVRHRTGAFRCATNWLNDKMPQRWMGRGSPNMPWPPRSPDLTPCDFFLWGLVKSKVYKSRPSSVPELKERIIAAFQEVTTDMCQQTVLAYRERLHQLTENGGRHVELH